MSVLTDIHTGMDTYRTQSCYVSTWDAFLQDVVFVQYLKSPLVLLLLVVRQDHAIHISCFIYILVSINSYTMPPHAPVATMSFSLINVARPGRKAPVALCRSTLKRSSRERWVPRNEVCSGANMSDVPGSSGSESVELILMWSLTSSCCVLLLLWLNKKASPSPPVSLPTPADCRHEKLMGEDDRCSMSLLIGGLAGVWIVPCDVSMLSGAGTALAAAGDAVRLECCMIK